MRSLSLNLSNRLRYKRQLQKNKKAGEKEREIYIGRSMNKLINKETDRVRERERMKERVKT
jgi:hypothetical protein